MDLFGALTFCNPWWRGESDWLQALTRDKVDEIKELLPRPEILTITGVRRSGWSSRFDWTVIPVLSGQGFRF